jgi:hypothetical protein
MRWNDMLLVFVLTLIAAHYWHKQYGHPPITWDDIQWAGRPVVAVKGVKDEYQTQLFPAQVGITPGGYIVIYKDQYLMEWYEGGGG